MRTTVTAASDRLAVRGCDVVVAVGCLVIALTVLTTVPVLEASSGGTPTAPPPGSATWWAVAVVLVLQGAALVGIRRYPLAAAFIAAGLPVPLALAGPGTVFSPTALAVMPAVYLAGTSTGRLLGSGVIPFLFVTIGTAINLMRTEPVGPLSASLIGIGQALFVVGLPLLISLIVVRQRETREARRREMAALDRERRALVREQEARVASAIAAERTAVARDLHDIAAHHMSGIAMLAAAIERGGDAVPVPVRESARDIRSQSTAVLADLRRIVGLLREDDMAPLTDRSLASIRRLVDERRASGTDVTLTIRMEAFEHGSGVGALAQLVGYRMVQEALANAAMHAPGASCAVVIDGWADDRVRIVVRNDRARRISAATDGRGGFGLIGMRERAELVGATLGYGPAEDGGWAVTLELPRGAHDGTDKEALT